MGSVRIPVGIQNGSWHDTPMPWTPEPFDKNRVIGKMITGICAYAGTYGMGGPGFVAFELNNNEEENLIVCVWAARSWMLYDGKVLPNDKDLAILYDLKFKDVQTTKNTIEMVLIDKGDKTHKLEIPEDLTKVPMWPNNHIKHFDEEDDLRKALCIAPSVSVFI